MLPPLHGVAVGADGKLRLETFEELFERKRLEARYAILHGFQWPLYVSGEIDPVLPLRPVS